MNMRIKAFLRKGLFPLLLVFATAPIPLFLHALFAPELLWLCWLVPAVYVLFVLLSFLIPGKWRLLYGICATVLLVALGASVLLVVPNVFLLAIPLVYGALLLWSLPMAGWDQTEALPFFCYWGGLLLHVIAQILKFILPVFELANLEATAPWLLLSFFTFAALAMITLTMHNLSTAAHGRKVPLSMQHKNLVLVLVLFALSLLISMMPAIIRAIHQFFDWLWSLLYDAWATTESTDVAPVATMPMQSGEMEPMEPRETGLITQIFNVLFIIMGSALTIGVFFYAARLLIKLLRKLIKRLLSGLSDYAANVTEDYIDEITDTRTNAPRKKKNRLSAADERAMTPAQRIRYRYLRLLYKHPEWDSGSTARENLPPEAASVYEQARYSPHPVTQEDAARFASKTKRI